MASTDNTKKASTPSSTSSASSASAASAAGSTFDEPWTQPSRDPLNQTEKQYLKGNFGDEYHFLRDHGLRIWKDDDREDGRVVPRMNMEGKQIYG
ncbi:hypothetical protein BKA56DRAFT_586181 [Ilyonectria sp. MPI-CAGE-AT-0026]|nr:hypothetical protein BKA56DRAFT_586181 [Ilyonectria sp. MPI-CAGE-AT-0026]